jgi:hypothetical protein
VAFQCSRAGEFPHSRPSAPAPQRRSDGILDGAGAGRTTKPHISAAEDAPVEYYGISNAGRINGGIIPWSSQMGDVPPNWGVYFSVADCDAALSASKNLAGV